MSKQSIRLTDGSNTIYPECAESGTGYCKFADGTLMTWGSVSATGLTSLGTYFGSAATYAKNFYYANGQSFVGTPQLFVSNNGELRIATIGSVLNGAADVYVFSRLDDGVVNYNWLAIGRWK